MFNKFMDYVFSVLFKEFCEGKSDSVLLVK